MKRLKSDYENKKQKTFWKASIRGASIFEESAPNCDHVGCNCGWTAIMKELRQEIIECQDAIIHFDNRLNYKIEKTKHIGHSPRLRSRGAFAESAWFSEIQI